MLIELAKHLPAHHIPTIHLGRLSIAEKIGVFAVDVVALHAVAKAFYLRFGFVELTDDQLHLFLPLKQIRVLFSVQ